MNTNGNGVSRRQFLRYSAAMGASLASFRVSQFPRPTPSSTLPRPKLVTKTFFGVRIVDAHAHPNQFYLDNPTNIDPTSTIEAITSLGMVASSFAAVGDIGSPDFYGSTLNQLSRARALADAGTVRMVLSTSDIPQSITSGVVPGAILTIEGGDPLQGRTDRVNEFYGLGVRIITLIHNRNNELGDQMRDPVSSPRGLTSAGANVVSRMQALGMVVDVAHARSETLLGVAAISRKPIIDSHCSPKYPGSTMNRLRTWQDMEAIAGTGGVVCTWPFAHEDGTIRRTFTDWANEILAMKSRLGIAHVGLGTDGGGNLPALINSYRNVQDLSSLAAAMRQVGLSQMDISAYFGGNFLRVFQQCVG